jgi:hypothetical protein
MLQKTKFTLFDASFEFLAVNWNTKKSATIFYIKKEIV